jgi:TonB-linked SusC/RagA family outer membrane protein
MKKLIIFVFGVLICATSVYAQTNPTQITVSGVVRDSEGAPIAGAVLYIRDATTSTSTDAEGRYSMRTTAFRVLVVSYMGMKVQEYQLKDQDEVVDFTMEMNEENVLDDVVITAVGTQKRVSVTGAVSTVSVTDIKTPSMSVVNALAGNVPGIMAMQRSGVPGENTSEFWIRGISTFGGGSSAMVMVDGFERSMDELNIEDIESFSVLKDASATAIYGSRGANGVILITTKRGSDGKVSVNGKAEYTYTTRTKTPKLVDGVTYVEMANEARTTRNQRPAYSDLEVKMIREQLDPDIYPNVDWAKLLLKNSAPTYRASLDVSGGGATARYFLSGSYQNEGGMYNVDKTMKDYNTNANYERYNYRLNLDMNVTSTTKVHVGVSGSLQKKNHGGFNEYQIWDALFGYNPVATPVFYSNGYAPVSTTLTIAQDGSVDDAGNVLYFHIPNPWVTATQTGYTETWNNKIETNVSLDQDLKFITPGLKFAGRFGFDTDNENIIRRRKQPELWMAEKLRDTNGDIVFRRAAQEILMFQTSEGSGNRKDFLEMDLVYNRTFGDHELSGILKYTQDNFVNTVNVGRDVLQGIAKRHQGLAGNAKYSYRGRYFADFTFGYNGSENFAKGHQFGFFPAFSAAWNVAEESFLKDVSWLNMFKIRYSYGKVGTDNTTAGNRLRFPYLPQFGYALYGGGIAATTATPNNRYNWGDINSLNAYMNLTYLTIASNQVSWEVATTQDVGIDLVMLKNNLEVTADYFDTRRTGIYMVRNFMPGMVGLSGAPAANVGEVISRGFDSNFKLFQRVGEVFVTLRGNIVYSKNEILEYDEMVNRYPYISNIGYRVDQARGLIALGLFKDYEDIRNSPRQTFAANPADVMPGDIKYKDVNGDGVIDNNDIVPIGATVRPNLTYGMGISFQWKGFDLSVHFQGVGKSNFFISNKSVWPFYSGTAGWGNFFKDVADADRWILNENEDVNASYPRLSYGGNANNYRNSTFWLRNGAYLRLKTLDLGYTMPQSVSSKLYMNKLRFYVTGLNVLTFSSFKMWDPEMGSSTGETYPLPKSWTFGLTFNL